MLILRKVINDDRMRRWKVQELWHQADLGLNFSSIISLANALNSFVTEILRFCLMIVKILSISKGTTIYHILKNF